jgi:UTP--glucose-1-phosphate uridylyltransferase
MTGDLLPTEALCAAYGEHERSVISVSQVPDSEVSKYGIIEKPEQEDAPSNLASIGRYVFSAKIFDVLRDQKPGHGGEIQLADAINTLAEKGVVLAQCITGTRYDCGSKFGYLEAIVDAALAHDEYSERFREMLMQRLSRREAAE